MRGRFAPSPTGVLHLGNLRTALAAWLAARSDGSAFVLRFEDLDPGPVRPEFYDSQRSDLERLGLDWDEELRQSDHLDRYQATIDRLIDAGFTYPCFCSRREIREAASAPHGLLPDGAYPGTCRSLDRAGVKSKQDRGLQAALRLRSPMERRSIFDGLAGEIEVAIDDVVLRRRDGIFAYNLVVVVDDAFQGIEEVVRGDDLVTSSPRQAMLAEILGLAPVSYLHIPLVLGPDGKRLAKRDGAVTLEDRVQLGQSPAEVRTMLARSLGIDAQVGDSAADLIRRFSRSALSTDPWTIDPGPGSTVPPRHNAIGAQEERRPAD